MGSCAPHCRCISRREATSRRRAGQRPGCACRAADGVKTHEENSRYGPVMQRPRDAGWGLKSAARSPALRRQPWPRPGCARRPPPDASPPARRGCFRPPCPTPPACPEGNSGPLPSPRSGQHKWIEYTITSVLKTSPVSPRLTRATSLNYCSARLLAPEVPKLPVRQLRCRLRVEGRDVAVWEADHRAVERVVARGADEAVAGAAREGWAKAPADVDSSERGCGNFTGEKPRSGR